MHPKHYQAGSIGFVALDVEMEMSSFRLNDESRYDGVMMLVGILRVKTGCDGDGSGGRCGQRIHYAGGPTCQGNKLGC
ncbi:hypothetical protein RB195_017516 [Necator americanus]|uniref:Uncharacterized protein n=1 Tax=Necator americanus TaxID=51031 RepID=A0ABR1C8R5_NECAM